MAKTRKKKSAPVESIAPDSDSQHIGTAVAEVLDNLPQPGEQAEMSPPQEQEAQPADAKQNEVAVAQAEIPSKKRWQDKLRGGMTSLPGVKIWTIDNGNIAGIGHRLDYADAAERPSKAVKDILSESGHYYDQEAKSWRKQVVSREERQALKTLDKNSEEYQRLEAEIRERASRMREERDTTHAEIVEQIRREQAGDRSRQ